MRVRRDTPVNNNGCANRKSVCSPLRAPHPIPAAQLGFKAAVFDVFENALLQAYGFDVCDVGT
jgi:hypothetical protein